jgi:hypothetical protein
MTANGQPHKNDPQHALAVEMCVRIKDSLPRNRELAFEQTLNETRNQF